MQTVFSCCLIELQYHYLVQSEQTFASLTQRQQRPTESSELLALKVNVVAFVRVQRRSDRNEGWGERRERERQPVKKLVWSTDCYFWQSVLLQMVVTPCRQWVSIAAILKCSREERSGWGSERDIWLRNQRKHLKSCFMPKDRENDEDLSLKAWESWLGLGDVALLMKENVCRPQEYDEQKTFFLLVWHFSLNSFSQTTCNVGLFTMNSCQ